MLDEIGFYALEGTETSDVEGQASVLHRMGTIPGARLIKISSQWLPQGVLYDDVESAWGHNEDADFLVWRLV